ncbi:MAG: DUF2207 domain-containing protein, partial [Saprospiraceae bacterium]
MYLQRYALVFLFLFAYLGSKAEYFVINDYKVDIHVLSKEGIFEVTETITVEFSEPRRGIFRKIPFRYKISGEEIEIKIFDTEVKDYRYKTYT